LKLQGLFYYIKYLGVGIVNMYHISLQTISPFPYKIQF